MIDTVKYGPWAVIPGGSEGVGAAFARKLGKAGINLVLIARKQGPLEEVARAIRAESGVQVRTLAIDLTRPDMLERVREVTDDVDVGLLVYNAGASHRTGDFLDGTIDDALQVILLNPVGQASLSYLFGKKMAARGRGGIILVGSLAGSAGAATVAAYGGAKAFTQIFAEGLWAEFKQHGIDVLCMVLGTTDTPALARVGMKFAPGEAADSGDIAQQGLDNIANGPVYLPPPVVEGFRKLGGMPRRQAAETLSGLLRSVQPSRPTSAHT
ncbi:MAG: SDR family NAD(P)-dependent oxidoreductase [Rhodospirillaceae bacterium]|nr:MAG: SDR family NAD(P)-dependent oxidoreductase [Rhodospirillaceae bacterium]